MDKKTCSILEDALSKSETALAALTNSTKRNQFENQIRELRQALLHSATQPIQISDALTLAKQVLDLREAVQRTVVYADLEHLYSRDRAKARALFTVRAYGVDTGHRIN